MSFPNKRDLTYSYTGFQQSQGDNSFPGTYLDTDLADLKASIDESITFIEGSFRSDGVLLVSAMPTAADLSAYVGSATTAATTATAAASSASSSATTATNAATTATNAASSATTTLANALVKTNNLSDLSSAATARTNLGLGSAATQASTAFATAAQGALAASALQALPSGSVVQVQNTLVSAWATGTTLIPYDDTIPQNTEGDQYMSLAITPTNVNNKLKIEVVFNWSSSATGRMTAALFQDSGVNALAAVSEYVDTANANRQLVFTHYMTAGTVSSTTFKVRAGSSAAGTTGFNGGSSSRLFGGVMASSITITEIKA